MLDMLLGFCCYTQLTNFLFFIKRIEVIMEDCVIELSALLFKNAGIVLIVSIYKKPTKQLGLISGDTL